MNNPEYTVELVLYYERPGSALKELLASIGITPEPHCHCLELMILMDEWGVEGCREHLTFIVNQMEEDSVRFRWNKRITAAGYAILSGLAFKINWMNPFVGIVEEALRQAGSPLVEV